MEATTAQLSGLAYALVATNVITQPQALSYHQVAHQQQQSLIRYLTEQQLVTSRQIAKASASAYGVPWLDLEQLVTQQMPLQLISEALLEQHCIIPLYQRGEQLFVAMADPSELTVLRELQVHTGLQPYPIVVEYDKLLKWLATTLHSRAAATLIAYLAQQPELTHTVTQLSQTVEDTPIVKFVHNIIDDAIKQQASDIHFEPYEASYRIRYRVDGLLYTIATPPLALGGRITARLKIMAELDIAEKRLPQDGRFKLMLGDNQAIDFRISSCPTVAGEKVVLRLLQQTTVKLGIDALGFTATQQQLVLKMLQQPHGMIIVTGPTGSGKTVTLYSMLRLLNQTVRNIATVEDPVEIKVAGINQVTINLKTGLTFAMALRALLRQDPDIIMVGEIRDAETAAIAIRAAQTGHLVLATLHTNDAASGVTRLRDMGIPADHIANAVTLLMAQRLARQYCAYCRLHQLSGCEQCQAGYKGRTGIFEIMPITPHVRASIVQHADASTLQQLAKTQGMLTLREAALAKVAQGITSVAEIDRVIWE